MKSIKNIKALLDMAIARGLFSNSEAVQQIAADIEYLTRAVEQFERSNEEKRYPKKGRDETVTMPG